MPSRTRIALILVAATSLGITSSLTAQNPSSPNAHPPKPNFDIRIGRGPVLPTMRAAAELGRLRSSRQMGRSRVDANTGALRVLSGSGWWSTRRGTAASIGNTLAKAAGRLGLENADLGSLRLIRDYESPSTGLRHVTFAQVLDGIPVLGGVITVHIADTGEIVRVTSGAASGVERQGEVLVSAEQAAILAAGDIRPEKRSLQCGWRVRQALIRRPGSRAARSSATCLRLSSGSRWTVACGSLGMWK
jgi:hypothetical protein